MVVSLLPEALSLDHLEHFAQLVVDLSQHLGKARRISISGKVEKRIAALLYGSFHCVEGLDSRGNPVVVDVAVE